jgi:hypothetical protein
MDIELNFEVGMGVCPNVAAALFEELARGLVVSTRVAQSSYNGPDGEVNTQTVVAKVSCIPHLAVGIAYRLACDLGEDCVAVRFSDTAGQLVGPNAAKWGAFNPDFFIRF